MDQVLVLNGLSSLVDTRGTGASCAQRLDGTVTCLDTPLGLSAAQAAQAGGATASYVAERLDVLAQESRSRAADITARADALDAAASSALQIGNNGGAMVAARAGDAAKLMARAALAQSAAAAAAAQAVRTGNAEQARMAGDAVVAAAWRGDTAEVQAGALMGIRLGDATGTPLTLKQGLPKDISDVAKFTIAEPRTVKGQLVGTKLVALGVKPGTTTLETVSPTGARKTYTVKVESLLPMEQLQAAQQLFNDAKAIGNAPGINIDWQDANVLRASYDAIYPPLRWVYATARDEGRAFDTFRPQRYQSLFLLRVLEHAKARPDLLTLRDVVLSMPAFTDTTGMTVRAPTGPTGGFSPTGRECTPGKIFSYAGDYAASREGLMDAFGWVLKIAEFVAKLWEGADDSDSTAVSSSIKAASTAAAPFLPEFANSPKKIVRAFGNAVCIAVAGGSSALPVAIRAASALRSSAVRKGFQFKLAAGNALTASSEEDRRSSAARALALKAEIQQTLADLNRLDVPVAFTAAETAQLEEVKAAVNVDASLTPSSGGSGGGGGGTPDPAGASAAPVIAVGAAAAAFALWRFLR